MPPYSWDEAALRYRDARGRFVARAQVAGIMRAIIASAMEDIRQSSRLLRGGKISLGAWQLQMERSIKNVHIAAYGLATGGMRALTDDDIQTVSEIVRGELGWLDAFVDDLARGLNMDGWVMARIDAYLLGGVETFAQAEAEHHIQAGFREERNLLGPAEHCDECVSLTELGWQPIGTLKPIGQRTCRHNDRCRIVYRR